MTKELYRYAFHPHVPLEEIAASLLLAVWGAVNLHGENRVAADAAHSLDPNRRACVIDAGTPAGRDVNRLFAHFVRRELSADCYRVDRIVADPNHTTDEAHA
jgi:hypothetical protein